MAFLDVNVRLAWAKWNTQQAQPADVAPHWAGIQESGFTAFAQSYLEWRDPINAPPDEATLESIWMGIAASLADEMVIETARNGLKDKIALAHDPAIAPHIKDLYNTVLEQIRVNADLATTYAAYLDTINAASNAFKNRYATYVLNRTNIDIAALPHTVAQQRNILVATDAFAILLVPLLQ